MLPARGYAADANGAPFLALPLADDASYKLLYRRNSDPSPKLAPFDEKVCRWPSEYHFDGNAPLELPSKVDVVMADGFDYLDDDELFWLVADTGELYKLPERDELTPVRSGWKRLSVSQKLTQFPKKTGPQALYLRRKREGVFAIISTWTGAAPAKIVIDPTTWRKVHFEIFGTAPPGERYYFVGPELSTFPVAETATPSPNRATVRLSPGPYLLSMFRDVGGKTEARYLIFDVTGETPLIRIDRAKFGASPRPLMIATTFKPGIETLATELATVPALPQSLKISQILRRIISDDARAYYAKYDFAVDLALDGAELRNESGDTYEATASDVRLDNATDSVQLTDSSLAAAAKSLGALRDGVPVRYRMTAKVVGEPCRKLEADIYETPGGAKMGNVEVWTQPRSRRIQWHLKDRWAPIVTNDDTAPPIITADDTTGAPKARPATDDKGRPYIALGHNFLNFLGERDGEWVSYLSRALPAKVWLKIGKDAKPDENGVRPWSYTQPVDYLAAFPAFEASSPIKDAAGKVAVPAKRRFTFVSQDANGAVIQTGEARAVAAKPSPIPWTALRDELGKPRFLPAPAR